MPRNLLIIALCLPLTLFANSFSFYLPKEDQHLTYRSVAIQNSSSMPEQLQQINLSPLPANVELCTAGSSCLIKYQNTCTTRSVLAPGAHCLLWLHAKASAQFLATKAQVLTLNILNSHQESSTHTFQVAANSNVFAAGDFTQPTNHIARWDGQRWLTLGAGLTGAAVENLVEYDGDLVAGGDFYQAGAKDVNFLARWNGQDWQPVGNGIGDPGPSALTVYHNSLFVGGGFDQVDGDVDAHYLAAFYDERWTGFETNLDYPILSLASTEENLYLAGDFHEPALQVGVWRDNHVEPLGAGVDDVVFSLATTANGTLYAGGAFTASGPIKLNHIGAWDGQHWLPLADGLGGEVYALSTNENVLYAGGRFDRGSTQSLSAIARWDGHHWQALAGGVTRRVNPSFTTVYSIASTHDDVFVGGYFNQANNKDGVIAANSIAHWQNSTQTWQALGTGLNDTVRSILIVPVLELSDV
jgi:hypothetical protein